VKFQGVRSAVIMEHGDLVERLVSILNKGFFGSISDLVSDVARREVVIGEVDDLGFQNLTINVDLDLPVCEKESTIPVRTVVTSVDPRDLNRDCLTIIIDVVDDVVYRVRGYKCASCLRVRGATNSPCRCVGYFKKKQNKTDYVAVWRRPDQQFPVCKSFHPCVGTCVRYCVHHCLAGGDFTLFKKALGKASVFNDTGVCAIKPKGRCDVVWVPCPQGGKFRVKWDLYQNLQRNLGGLISYGAIKSICAKRRIQAKKRASVRLVSDSIDADLLYDDDPFEYFGITVSPVAEASDPWMRFNGAPVCLKDPCTGGQLPPELFESNPKSGRMYKAQKKKNISGNKVFGADIRAVDL